MRASRFAIFAIFSLVACQDITSIMSPNDTSLTPPSVYRSWWDVDIACSQLTAQRSVFDDLTWFEVHDKSLEAEEKYVVAKTYWPSRVIRIDSAYVDDENVVRHEMLHAILYAAGKTQESVNHDPLYFRDRCGVL